jgi:nucleoid-associated protein YgaU
MTLAADRGAGLPMVCPFVAFADERDLRAAEPDHRHRCYAEPRPAPRALAHQTRYCLSPGFTSCPTFQDWATREAARVADEPRPVGAAGGALPGFFDDERGPATVAPPPGAVPASAFAPPPDELEEREPGGFRGPYAEDERERGGFRGPYADDDADLADDGDRDDAFGEPGGVAGRRIADWDRPRPRRDYPRIGRSGGVPPVLVGVVILAMAALALFFLPTIITAILGSHPAGASPNSSGSVAASGASPTPAEPTAVPSPTPLTYKVVSGDNLTKIANKFKVTVAQILAANPTTIKNADSITVGQVIVIPTAGASASSSAAP